MKFRHVVSFIHMLFDGRLRRVSLTLSKSVP